MVLDIILVVLFVFMMLYGYKKGCIGIVARLVSLIVAFILAYLLAGTIGEYIQGTSLGENITTSIESNVLTMLENSEDTTIISIVKEKINFTDGKDIVGKITNYVFMGIAFILVFVVSRIVIFIVQKILESIFELPVLKTFNKLGGIIASVLLFLIEISIILAVVKSISSLNFMSGTINFIQSSVITKALYDHNIFTNIFLSKIF